jgi:hypothetical protein
MMIRSMINYFKKLADLSFKMDESGRALYYPWGSLGRGYIVPDKATEDNIRYFLVIYQCVVYFSFIALFIVQDVLQYQIIQFNLFFGLVFIIWLVGINILTRNLTPSEIKLSFRESILRAARFRSRALLWVVFIGQLLFIAVGISMFINPESPLLSILFVLFFTALAALIGYMLKIKDN